MLKCSFDHQLILEEYAVKMSKMCLRNCLFCTTLRIFAHDTSHNNRKGLHRQGAIFLQRMGCQYSSCLICNHMKGFIPKSGRGTSLLCYIL